MDKLRYLLLLFLMPLFLACDDIFVEDISEDSVTLIAPGEGVILKNHEVTLAWEALEDAEDYRVVIVSPAFENVHAYICDSVTDQYKIKITLDPGSYEWSVQARNSEYQSLKSFRKFEIADP